MGSQEPRPNTMDIQKAHILAPESPRIYQRLKTLPIVEDDEVDLRSLDRALAVGFPDIYWGPETRIQRVTAGASNPVRESSSINMQSGCKGGKDTTGTDMCSSQKIGLSAGFERYWQDISNEEVITLLHNSGLIRTVKERIEPDFCNHRLKYYQAKDWTACGMKEAKEDWEVFWAKAVKNGVAILKMMKECGMEDEVRRCARREFFVGNRFA
ncbi:hypothetical protein MFRU_006g03550 [Monilinia fructicola]|nr:hypothetical protein MFRU_006g03550 [Monilinia fructicola]